MRRVGDVLRGWLNLALIDAIRTGAPQPRTWSFGLRAVTVVGAIAFLLAGALTALSPLLRQHTELAVGANRLVIPTWSAPLVIWILVV
ncbi:MAG: hypothetical protein GXX86_10745, partial [Propionibacterium sp.]|nr:hypothetical protein [Propionibacterium sp.]